MFTVLACIRDDHDLRLVLLAAVICGLASATAMRFHCRTGAEDDRTRLWLLGLTGAIAGAGVWATHFVAMLAFEGQLVIQFDILLTVLSLVVAILGMTGGFALASMGHKAAWRVAGGTAVGLTIAVMHFVGIAAMRTAFHIEWDPVLVGASIVLSVTGATLAILAVDRTEGLPGWIVPPLALVAGIVGLHFTAMAAITLQPNPTAPVLIEMVERADLAIMVGGIAILIILGAATMALMETRLRHAAMRNLDVAFQGVPTGLAMFDPNGRLVIWNDAYARMMSVFGIRPALGMTRRSLALQAARSGECEAPDTTDLSQWAMDVEAERRSGRPQEWQSPSGGWIRAETSRLDNGGSISVVTDITAEKSVSIAMADARDRAEAANRAKSDFLANMSHEIRTPLNGVLGMAQVMAGDELSAKQAERLGVIRESGATLLAILNDLLDLAKVQAGKMELERTEADVAGVARGLAAAFEGSAAERDITLDIEVGADVEGQWMVDGLRLRQILANLVSNAIKFTHEGGVHLQLSTASEGLRFDVTDSGIGIEADRVESLFEKFVQADGSTTRRYGGTGLGLAICQELVSLMDGTIAVSSTPGQGSVFTVLIPSEKTADVAPVSVLHEPAAAPSRPLRILAAEDNPTNQLVLRSILSAIDCEADIVSNGREAVAAAQDGGYDLILMDIQMPEMNGLDATGAIRRHEAATGAARVPILALTANVMAHQVDNYLVRGFDDCVAKPIQVEDLYRAIDGALKSAPLAA